MTYIIDAICEGDEILIFINFIIWCIAIISAPFFILYLYKKFKLLKEGKL